MYWADVYYAYILVRIYLSCTVSPVTPAIYALDGTEDDVVWDDQEEEEEAEEPIDKKFKTYNKAKDDKMLSSAEISNNWYFSEPPWVILEPTNQIKSKINVVCDLFIHLPVFTYSFQFNINYQRNLEKFYFLVLNTKFSLILIDLNCSCDAIVFIHGDTISP